MNKTKQFVPGLEGVVAAETRLSDIDGQAGQLIIAGFPVEVIADRATYEEMVYLLWHDRLPDATQLSDFKEALVALRPLPRATYGLLEAAAAQQLPAMDALRMAAGTLNLSAGNQGGSGDATREAMTLIAAFPTIVAAYWRLRQGQAPLDPEPSLGHTANYLYMLTGQTPDPAHVRGLETYLNTVIDHGLNASTFAARVIISTESDMVSAVVGAIGALKGPRHGGAPGPALDTVFEIGEASRAEVILRAKLECGQRLMGFGHRVYKVRDPRAEILSAAAEQMFHSSGDDLSLYELAKAVEETAVALLAEYKPGRNLQTNVEFYTALLLHGLGLKPDLFTPTFAISRVGGWTAHCFEQLDTGRIIRPLSAYGGITDRPWIPLAER